MPKNRLKSPEDRAAMLTLVRDKFVYSEESRGLELANPKRASFVHHTGYKMVSVGCGAQLEHRVIWLLIHGEWPDGEIDHINGDKLDNRIENLRLVDRWANARNRGPSKRSTTGIAGIYRERGKFLVKLNVCGKPTRFGYFQTIDEARERLLQVTSDLYPDAQVRLARMRAA